MSPSDSPAALPRFRFHLDPLASGSIVQSPRVCLSCKTAREFIYAGPVYCEVELDEALCPWCIADGTAHATFDVGFVDSEAFDDDAPHTSVEEVMHRTPGYAAWQSGRWPSCCGDLTAYIGPFGYDELNKREHYELQGPLMSHIVHDMGISGGAATRLMQSLKRNQSPTLFVFRCLNCNRSHLQIDSL